MDVVVKQEKDCSWLDSPINNRTCEWCSAPDFMNGELPKYVNVPLDDWPGDLLLDLCYCYDCVQEYHRLQEELIVKVEKHKKVLQLLDIDRLARTITNALENVGERKVFAPPLQDVATKLQVPLLEILKFPYLLHNERLARLFQKGLIALNVCSYPLKLEEKLPGTYLLLVHPDPEVRGWAVKSVRGQGLINPDDYDFLKEVIKWMIQVVEFYLFDYADLMTPENKQETLPFEYLPSHLFMPLTIREYWQGLFVLLRQMDVTTVQSCFMSSTGHMGFLNTIVSPMENQEDEAFGPKFQCFVVLLERLGNRIWQISAFNYKPDHLFIMITNNHVFHNAVTKWQNQEDEATFSQEVLSGDSQRTRASCDTKFYNFYNTAVAWYQPFVQSLLDFDSGGDCLSLVIEYLHKVADNCSYQNTFKSDVQSALLKIIYDLLNKRMFVLLVPTVRLWAIDIIDVVIFELGDKKVLEGTRTLLQHLLKGCHRLGHKHALKYWELFRFPGLKQLSAEDKQQIISLLVQSFEAQRKLPFQVVHSRHGSKAPVVSPSCSTKAEHQTTQPTLPLKEIKVQGSCGNGDSNWLAGENSDTTHQEDIRSQEKPGPSTRFTSSEDEEEEEEETFWIKVKRLKKSKHSLGNIKVSKKSMTMRGKPIQARVTLSDVMASSVGILTAEKGIKSVALQSTTQPKQRHTARKSAGRTKMHAPPIQQNCGDASSLKREAIITGATPDDAIIIISDSDDDGEFEAKISEQKEPISKGDKGAGILDDYFYYNSSESDDVALMELVDELESPANAVKTYSTIQNTTSGNSSMKATISSDNNSSDDVFSIPVMESNDISFTSVEPSAHGNVSPKVKTGKTRIDYNTASCTAVKGIIDESGDVMDYDNESDDFSLQDMNKLESPPNTKKPFSRIQSRAVSNSSAKADLLSENDTSDDEPLSSYAAHKAFNSSSVKTPAHDIAPRMKTGEMVFDGAINVTSLDTSAHDIGLPEVKTERMEVDVSSFPERKDIAGEVDYIMDPDGSSDVKEEKYENERDGQPIFQTVEPESMAQEEEKTSLSTISGQLQNDAVIDDGMNFWLDYYGYSELVLNSQENALASVEEDLDDLYSTQIESVKEDNTILSSTDDNDKAIPDEVIPNEKAKKHVSFAIDSSPGDTVANSSRPSVSQIAITKPSRALSEDEFFHKILSWKVDLLHNSRRNGRPASQPWNCFAECVPECFESMDQYYNTFKPLLFMEIREQALTSWEKRDVNRKRVAMDVLDGSFDNNFWVIPCSGLINEQQQKQALFPLESDLVLVTRIAADGRGGSEHSVFGVVEKAEVKRVQPSRRVSMGSSGGEDESTEAKFQLTLNIKTTLNFRPVRNCRLQVEFVTSLLTALRQWVGLMHLSKSLLACDILRPRKTDYFCSNDYHQSSHVAKEYNESQEKVISTAANAVHMPFPIPRICLVQGPPGTGKSYTIVGLVKEILNRTREMPTQPTAVPSNGALPSKVRILLCAPSNAAIDELIGRITEAQIQLEKRHDNKEIRRVNRQDAVKTAFSNNCGDLCLVRVGRKSHIHPAVMKFSLDSMTKKILANASASAMEDNLNSIKERLKAIDASEKKLEREIWKLQTSPDKNELEKLQNEKAKLRNCKHHLEMKCRTEKTKQANKRREEARIRRDILDCADVVCTTLNGAGSTCLTQDQAGRRVCPFTCVIVDEACQSNELDLLIPLGFQASKLVLVGDPEQLPSTVLSMEAKDKLLGRSMFGRLYKFFRHHKKEMEKPVLMLEEQYRMHPEIAAFPSGHIYSNCLKNHRSLEKRPFPLEKHYALFDVRRGQEKCQDKGALWNPSEADVIANLCRDLTKTLHADSIGIITPYRKQKFEIQNRLVNKGLSRGDATIEVNTVDGFQGREKDVIILSCVRAQSYRGSIGFLSDRQRMNVALTRARHALYVFGHMDTLKGGSTDWNALVEDAEKRRCLFPVESPAEVRQILSIGVTNDVQSPAKDPRLKANHISSKVSDSRGNSSSSDRAVHQVKASGEVPCAGPAVVPGSKDEKLPSATTEGRVGASADMTGETPNLVTISTVSTDSDPLHSSGRAASPAGESRRKDVTSTHVDRQEKEGRLPRDRHQKQTKEVQRHRPRSDDRRYQGHGHRDSGKRDHSYRHHHRHENRIGAAKESNHTFSEHSRYHSSHRDRDRDRDHDRVESSAHQGRHTEPIRKRPDSRVSHRSETTTNSLDKNAVSNAEEINSDNTLQMSTQNASLHSVIKNNANSVEGSAHQGRHMEPGRKRPDSRASHRSETTTTSLDKSAVSNAEEIDSDNTLQMSTHNVLLDSVIKNNANSVEGSAHQGRHMDQSRKRPDSRGSHRSETTTTSLDKNAVSNAEEMSSDNTHNVLLDCVLENNASHSREYFMNLERQERQAEAGRSPGQTGWSPARPECSSSETGSSHTEPAVTRAPNPGFPTKVLQSISASYSSAGPSPSTSSATHPNTPLHRTFEAAASSSSLAPRPITPQHSTPVNTVGRSFEQPSFEFNHSLDRRRSSSVIGELVPSAQEAADLVRQRYTPVEGPPIIKATDDLLRNPHGSRKRKAHDMGRDVSSLRERASGEIGSPTRRTAVAPRLNIVKKSQGSFRGRKNWNK